jgi:hypothetical protein
MEFFFITYGNNLLGCYSTIEAENYEAARKIAYEGTNNGKYAFFYEGKEELQRQIDRGFLDGGEINLQPMEV